MSEKKSSYYSRIAFILKKTFKEFSFKHFFSINFYFLFKKYRFYLQTRMVSKQNYIPIIRKFFSNNLNEIEYRTLIPQQIIEFTESEKEFLNGDISCSKLIKKKRDIGYAQREVFSCRLKNIKFFGHSGVLAIKDKPLLESACTLARLQNYTFSVDNIFLKHRKKKGVYTSIMQVWPEVFYHFLIESVSRFYGISKNKEQEINLIIPWSAPKWQFKILKIFLDTRFKLIRIKKNEVWDLEYFIFPSFCHIDCSAYFPKKISDFVRNKVFDYYGIQEKIMERKRRIFLSREKIGRKFILNRESFLNLIKDYGFEEIHPQDLSFKEQIEIINSAEIVIGISGSAMSNLIFGTNLKVILIRSGRTTTHFFLMCKALNFIFKQINGYDINDKRDCKVNLGELEDILKELISYE